MLIENRYKFPYHDIGESVWPMAAIPPGWLPADISSGRPLIRWVKVGVADLTEPFFTETLRKLRLGSPPALECETGLCTLEQGASYLAPVPPAGIIFHMSRCGSTLLANALRKADRAIVFSEAAAIGRVMTWIGSPSRHWSKLGGRLAGPLSAVLAHYQGQVGRRVVIKCSIEEIVCLPALRALWPTVPCLVLVRDPIEVLASNVQKPSTRFQEWYDSPGITRFGVPPAEVLAGSVVEFSAWTIGGFCSTAIAALDDGCRVLDYADITPNVAKQVAEYFNLSLSDEGEIAMRGVFQLNAKDPKRIFESDSAAKRLSATENMRISAARWMEEPYHELRRLANHWNNCLTREDDDSYPDT